MAIHTINYYVRKSLRDIMREKQVAGKYDSCYTIYQKNNNKYFAVFVYTHRMGYMLIYYKIS